jgi:hypothetical protein
MGMSDGVPGAFSDGVDYYRVVLPTRGGVTAGVVCLLVWVRLDGDHDFPLNSDGHARAHRTKYNTVSYNVRKY